MNTNNVWTPIGEPFNLHMGKIWFTLGQWECHFLQMERDMGARYIQFHSVQTRLMPSGCCRFRLYTQDLRQYRGDLTLDGHLNQLTYVLFSNRDVISGEIRFHPHDMDSLCQYLTFIATDPLRGRRRTARRYTHAVTGN